MFVQIKLHDLVVDMFLHSMVAFVKNNQINTFKLDKGISITIEIVQLDQFLVRTSTSQSSLPEIFACSSGQRATIFLSRRTVFFAIKCTH